MGGGDQLRFFGCIDAEETGMGDRWRTDPHMNLFGAGTSKHLINLPAGGCPDDRVIHCDDPFTLHQPFHRIQFDLDPEMANPLFRFDEGSSDIMISYHAQVPKGVAILGRSRSWQGIQNLG